ncbi:hypothetical protein Tco_0739953 [Tanacetum coccineum]
MEGLMLLWTTAKAARSFKGIKINSICDLIPFILSLMMALFSWVEGRETTLKTGCYPLLLHIKATGCNALVSPFNYLGLPIDYNMALVKSWDPIVEKFSNRLSKWKASLLSIGGRATLISSVLGAIGTYFFSLFPMPLMVNKKLEALRAKFFWGSADNSHKIPWIAWDIALSSKVKGGLGIGSLYSLNHALIQKWRWRFLNNPHALWSRLIVAIPWALTEGLTSSLLSHNIKSKSTTGISIVGSRLTTLHEKGLITLSSMQRRVNNGGILTKIFGMIFFLGRVGGKWTTVQPLNSQHYSPPRLPCRPTGELTKGDVSVIRVSVEGNKILLE